VLVGASLALAAGASTAGAVDGVVEINHAKALAGAVTAGDPAGYPVVISSPGSYRLTSNLMVIGGGLATASDADGIQITAEDVALDLNGFTISCRRTTIPATPCSFGIGVGRGIVATGVNVRIENGTIRDMASDGVIIGAESVYALEDVVLRNNGGHGFRAGVESEGRIFRSSAVNNEAVGFSFAQNSSALMLETTTVGNSNGLLLEAGTSVWGSELLLREETGIEAGLGRLGCVAFGSLRACP
jgi:hypothetical protein